jgi:hypothetical protein
VKRIVIILLALAMVLPAVSCKRNDWRNLEYTDIFMGDWLQATVKKKRGGSVLLVQVFDVRGDREILACYRKSGDRVGPYQARIYRDRWIWMLVNDRIEVRVIADDSSDEFKKNARLKRFLLSFNLAAMEKVTGPKISGKDMERFLPKLGVK